MDELRQKLLAVFPRRDQFIWKPLNKKRWEKANGPLLDHQILGVVSDEGRGLYRGCYWSHKTRHAVLDIDQGSKYHSAAELVELAGKLAAVGLTAKPYQSSDSTGWHIYLFFDDWEDCSQIEQTLKTWLKAQGYRIEGGQLEVFPSGNALRLPLQQGFGWLDPQGNLVRRREDITEDEALASFIWDLENNQRNWNEAKDRIESQLQVTTEAAGGSAQEHAKAINGEGFDDLFTSRIVRENYEKGRKYWLTGLTDKNQRHEAVICIEHYLWHGDQAAGLPAYPGRFNDDRRRRLITEWLEENHNGFCSHINDGDWATVEAQILRACQWRSDETKRAREYEPYPCTERAQEVLGARSMATGRTWTMDDLQKGNEGREKEARKKIKAAVKKCLVQGRQISRKTLEALTGCSPNTLRRHADLWKLFAAGSGDKNRGVLGGPSVCSGPPGSERNFLNPPLVADSGDLELDREEELSVCLGPVANSEETAKIQSGVEDPAPSIENIAVGHVESNGENQQELSTVETEKTLFILLYGALAASNGSASVPLRQLAGREVLAAAQEGLKQHRRHNSTAGSEKAAYRTSQKAQHRDRLTYRSAALPENHAAGEPVSKTGAASVYRLVIDTGGK